MTKKRVGSFLAFTLASIFICLSITWGLLGMRYDLFYFDVAIDTSIPAIGGFLSAFIFKVLD